MYSKPKNALEIFKLLDKSNCRKCGEKTCLAFAGAVFQDQRQLHECPQLPQDLVAQLTGAIETHPPFEPGLKYLEQLKSEVAAHRSCRRRPKSRRHLFRG